jgi:hypothetical protein
MKTMLLAVGCVFVTSLAGAQEHWTEGPVWSCSAYRTKQGQEDNYFRYLRQNFAPPSAEAKKQGLILDSKIFVQTPARADDWNVMICSLFPSYGKAMDYDADADKKSKAIQAQHWKTTDEEKQREMSAKRFEMRDFLGTSYVREVTLKPLP